MVGIDARTDADIDDQFPMINSQRPLKGLNNFQAGRPDALHVASIFQGDCELIAAESCRKPERSYRLLQTLGKTCQHAVAEGVSHAVIDILEIIDVEKQNPYLRSGQSGASDRGVEQGEPFTTIRKPRQRIVFRQLLELSCTLCDF